LVTALNTAFATGASIAGFPVETSAFTAVIGDNTTTTNGTTNTVYVPTPTPDSAEADRYRNIAIIVGVVIPCGLSNLIFLF
jgi:hypothetical protein